MKKYLFFFVIINFSLDCFAQQAIQFSQYMLNPYQFNVAQAGLENSLIATLAIRKQWLNLNNSPSSQNLTLHLPFYFLKGGIGLSVENDDIGVTNNSRITASYNFIYPISEKTFLSLGVGGGFSQHRVDGSAFRTSDGNYEPSAFDHKDPILSTSNQSAVSPTFQAGLVLQVENLKIGLSGINLLENSFELESIDGNIQFFQRRQFFANLVYDYSVNSVLSLLPSILFKTDLIEQQIDYSVLATIDDKYILGGSYRGFESKSQDAIAILVGIKFNEHITLSYSYDLGLSNLKTVHTGSHEILVKYDLNKKIGGGKLPNIIYNPRFL